MVIGVGVSNGYFINKCFWTKRFSVVGAIPSFCIIVGFEDEFSPAVKYLHVKYFYIGFIKTKSISIEFFVQAITIGSKGIGYIIMEYRANIYGVHNLISTAPCIFYT